MRRNDRERECVTVRFTYYLRTRDLAKIELRVKYLESKRCDSSFGGDMWTALIDQIVDFNNMDCFHLR